MVVPMPNVHTLARAQARADRMLADIGDPDIHVTATIRLPAAKATMLRSGMRVPILLTHEPEFNDGWKWCRIVNARHPGRGGRVLRHRDRGHAHRTAGLLWLTEDGTGGWTVTWPGSVTEQGTHDTTLSTTQRVILETIDGGTSWIATWIGSGGSAITIKNEGTPLATAATSLDFVGPLVTASGAGAAKTVTITGALDDLTDVTITTPATSDRLRYNGSLWVNSTAMWVPVMVEDGATGLWYVAVTGDGDATMTEVP
jgi:hypothetical protein